MIQEYFYIVVQRSSNIQRYNTKFTQIQNRGITLLPPPKFLIFDLYTCQVNLALHELSENVEAANQVCLDLVDVWMKSTYPSLSVPTQFQRENLCVIHLSRNIHNTRSLGAFLLQPCNLLFGIIFIQFVLQMVHIFVCVDLGTFKN